jgi:NAD(P)H dehydrogenase (quinone)
MMGPDPLRVPVLGMARARLSTLSMIAVVALAACGGSEGPEAGSEGGAAETAAPAEQSGDVIIVSGASGELGGLVVDELLDRGVAASRLILVSRTPNALARYAGMGASTRFGDFTQPESLAAAYEGGDRMLLISINTGIGAERADLHKNAIDAAAAAGVQHVAYTSLVDLDNNDSPLAADHVRTEQFLRDSGLSWTMLRNGLYMDGLVDQAMEMIVNGRVERSDVGAAYVTRGDCAAAAAAVLTMDGHENQAYDITGPAVVYPQDVATTLTEVTEMAVAIADPSGGAAAGAMSSPSFAVVSDAVQRLTGRAPTSLRDLFEVSHDDIMAGTGA